MGDKSRFEFRVIGDFRVGVSSFEIPIGVLSRFKRENIEFRDSNWSFFEIRAGEISSFEIPMGVFEIRVIGVFFRVGEFRDSWQEFFEIQVIGVFFRVGDNSSDSWREFFEIQIAVFEIRAIPRRFNLLWSGRRRK